LGEIPATWQAKSIGEVGEKLGRLADGGAYPAIRSEVIAGLSLVVPSDEKILTTFEKIARPTFAKAAQNRAESRTLTNLRDTLLPKLISGEIRLKDAERFLSKQGAVA
jgi:type I restriction enzyme, S subunit